MNCPELEELLREGPGGHAAHCEDCSALLEALGHVDATLASAFGHVSAPPGLAAVVRAQVAASLPVYHPTALPELLDLIGWAAILAAAAIVVPRFVPLLQSVLPRLG